MRNRLFLAAGLGLLILGASLPAASAATPAPFASNFGAGTPATPQPYRPGAVNDWVVAVHDRDMMQTFDAPYAFDAMHGADCSGFQGYGVGGTHLVSRYADEVFVCNGHLMTAINGQGYGEATLMPPVLLDWSGGATTVVTWQVSTLRTSCRDWLSYNVMPFADALFLSDGIGVDLYHEPRNELLFTTGASCPSAFSGQDIRNFNGVPISGPGGSVSDVVSETDALSGRNRQTFELDISSTHVRFGMPAYGKWFVDGNLASPLPYSQALISLQQHSYTPDKDCNPTPTYCAANTWHWSDFTASRSVPITTLNADAFQVSHPEWGYPDTVHFAAPAPVGSFLQMEEISYPGTMTVTTQSGQVIPITQQQASQDNPSGALTDGQVNLIFMPIPAGTTSLQFAAQDAYWTGWLARNIAILSLTTP